MIITRRILGPALVGLLATLLPLLATPADGASPGGASSTSAKRAGGFSCITDVLIRTSSGRVVLRRLDNNRTVVQKTSAKAVSWRPVFSRLVALERWPGYERNDVIVAATDGRVRIVRLTWRDGSSALSVKVLRVLGRGFPNRLITFDGRTLYWVGGDGQLRSSALNRGQNRLSKPRLVGHTVTDVTALTAQETNYGMRLFWAARDGSIHLYVPDQRRELTLSRPTGHPLRLLKSSFCALRNSYREVDYAGLVSVERTGRATFRRAVETTDEEKVVLRGSLTAPVVVRGNWKQPALG
ncbi:hypothetical protein [Nocardioides sp.]|uniref:hypothetical protein n=1 Tax=Nocardioides sp. TaxID=35761 RepID=UPI0035121002